RDWSSDVCSSDLEVLVDDPEARRSVGDGEAEAEAVVVAAAPVGDDDDEVAVVGDGRGGQAALTRGRRAEDDVVGGSELVGQGRALDEVAAREEEGEHEEPVGGHGGQKGGEDGRIFHAGSPA